MDWETACPRGAGLSPGGCGGSEDRSFLMNIPSSKQNGKFISLQTPPFRYAGILIKVIQITVHLGEAPSVRHPGSHFRKPGANPTFALFHTFSHLRDFDFSHFEAFFRCVNFRTLCDCAPANFCGSVGFTAEA